MQNLAYIDFGTKDGLPRNVCHCPMNGQFSMALRSLQIESAKAFLTSYLAHITAYSMTSLSFIVVSLEKSTSWVRSLISPYNYLPRTPGCLVEGFKVTLWIITS